MRNRGGVAPSVPRCPHHRAALEPGSRHERNRPTSSRLTTAGTNAVTKPRGEPVPALSSKLGDNPGQPRPSSPTRLRDVGTNPIAATQGRGTRAEHPAPLDQLQLAMVLVRLAFVPTVAEFADLGRTEDEDVSGVFIVDEPAETDRTVSRVEQHLPSAAGAALRMTMFKALPKDPVSSPRSALVRYWRSPPSRPGRTTWTTGWHGQRQVARPRYLGTGRGQASKRCLVFPPKTGTRDFLANVTDATPDERVN
jgi:hypothetical protein